MLLGKAALPPPADVGWSINNGGISAVGRCRLEYELQKILTIGWGINYISHCYPLCEGFSYAIVLRCIMGGEAALSAFLLKEFGEVVAGEFTATIRMKSFDFAPC